MESHAVSDSETKEESKSLQSRYYSVLKVQVQRSTEVLLTIPVTSGEVPPVPIPNTEVKLISVENTWREAARENRTVPTQIFLYSSVGRACGC